MRQGEGIVFSSLQTLLNQRSQVATLQLAKRHIKARNAGLYQSVYKGRGMDFAESRPYQAGDDIRSIDWRVTARSGKVHTKLFQEERERPVMVWVDCRPSMFFATQSRFKSVLATEITALLMWKALGESDRVGGFLQTADNHYEMKPVGNRSSVLHFLRQMAHATQQAPKTVAEDDLLLESWKRLRRVAQQGTHVFVVSDFRQASSKALRQLAQITQHAQVTLVQVSDPFEHKLPQQGRLRVTDGKRSAWLGLKQQWQKQYQQRAEQSQQSLQEFARGYRIPLMQISTAHSERERLQILSRGLT